VIFFGETRPRKYTLYGEIRTGQVLLRKQKDRTEYSAGKDYMLEDKNRKD
jgi:hypothetical protein